MLYLLIHQHNWQTNVKPYPLRRLWLRFAPAGILLRDSSASFIPWHISRSWIPVDPPHARINLTDNSLKKNGPMAAEPFTLRLSQYIKREDPRCQNHGWPSYVRNPPFRFPPFPTPPPWRPPPYWRSWLLFNVNVTPEGSTKSISTR